MILLYLEAPAGVACQSLQPRMIPKSGGRFSEKVTLKMKKRVVT
jgi:hypothetical protein